MKLTWKIYKLSHIKSKDIKTKATTEKITTHD